MKKIFFILIVILIFISPSFTQETRIALVIGNSEYLYQSKLKNPVRDAILMAQTLESLDFDVILDTNITTEDKFIDAISEFGTKRESYDVGFIFYAGHGMQVDGKNYLLPTEEDFKDDEKRVKQNAIGVEMVMEYLTKQTDQVNVLILDACRNNPIQNTRSVGVGGLAEMQSKGSLIAFSTTAGNVAKDGDGEHSIYCMSLVKNMLIEGIDLGQVFRNVRKEVNELTGQSTVNYDQLTGNAFYLKRASYTDDIILIDSLIEVENYTMALEEAIKILAKDPNNIPALKRKGIIKYRKYKAEYDGSDLKKAIQLDPMDPDLHVNMGRYYGVIKEYESAYAEFDKAIQLDSTYAEAYYWKARVFDEDDLVDSAIYYYSIAINLKPKEMLYYTTRAYFYQKQKLFDKALADYSKAIELDPYNPVRYDGRAWLYSVKKDYNNELLDRSKAIEVAPTSEKPFYLYNRGWLYANQLNKPQKALTDFKNVLLIDSTYADAINSFGAIYEDQGNIELAIETYNKGIALEKIKPKAAAYCYRNRAGIYQKQKLFDKALADYSKAIELDPYNPVRYENRARLYSVKKDYNNELLDRSKAIEVAPTSKKPVYLYSRGWLYANQLNKPQNAIEDFKNALLIDSTYVDAITWIGVIYKNQGNIELAIETYNKGIALEKIKPKAAAYCFGNRAFIYHKQKLFDKALADYNKAIELDPYNPVRYENRARLYSVKKDYNNELLDLSKAIEIAPTSKKPVYLYSRGWLYANQLNKPQNAIEDLKNALLIDSTYAEAINSLGVIYEDQGNIELAIETYNKGIALEKTNPKTAAYCYRNRAGIYQKQKLFDKALADYNKAIELDPYNPVRYDDRAWLYSEKKDYNNELLDLSKAIEVAPTSEKPFYLYSRGWLYADQLNKPENAIEDYTNALLIDPTYARAINGLGVIYEDQGNIELAIETYNKGIALEKIKPKAAAYCFGNRGLIYQKQKLFDKALADYNKAIELDPYNPVRYENRARLYSVKKDYNNELLDLSKAIEVAPTSEKPFYLYSRGYGYAYQLNKPQNAIEDYKNALLIDSTYVYAINGLGAIYDNQGNVELAIETYNKGIALEKIKPKAAANCFGNRAFIYQKQKLFDKALADYTKAIEIEPKKPFRYCNKGDLYRNHLNQPYNALNQYTTAINMDSSYYFAWSCRARTYGDKLHNYEMAIHDSKYITTHLDTNDVIILNWIGIYYHRLGKEKKAKAYYNKVIQKYNSGLKISEWDITNGVAWAFNNLGVYYQRDNDYLKAAKKYNKAVQIDTEEPARYYWRSWFYFNCSNQLDSALNDAQKAIDLDPENSKWLLSKAKMLELSNRMEEATEIYKKAKKLFPNNKDVQLENARFLGIIGKLKLSQKEFEKIKHLKTIDSRYLNYQTEIQFKNKGFNSVEKLANECIKIFPQDTLSRSYLADLLFQKGNYAASCSHYTYLISMMENNNKYLDYEPNLNQINLSELYIKLGNTFEKMKAPESQCMALKKALSNLDEMYGIYDKKRMEKELEEKIKTLCN